MTKTTGPAFELRVLPGGEAGYRLALWQRAIPTNGVPGREAQQIATLAGVPMQVALDQILDALRREGHRAGVLHAGQTAPLALSEEAGVRLGLLFLTLKPLTKVARMEAVAARLRTMPSEEAYYWFSQCARHPAGGQVTRALRIFLAPE